VCDLETSRMGAPYIYIYDISHLRVNSPRVRGPVLCQCATELREMRNSRVDDVCEQIE